MEFVDFPMVAALFLDCAPQLMHKYTCVVPKRDNYILANELQLSKKMSISVYKWNLQDSSLVSCVLFLHYGSEHLHRCLDGNRASSMNKLIFLGAERDLSAFIIVLFNSDGHIMVFQKDFQF